MTLALLLLGFLTPYVLWADNEVVLHTGYYTDNERLTVLTPSIRAEADIFERTTLRLQYIYEHFNRAAPDSPPEGALDAITGATTVSGGSGSGFRDTRHAASVGASQRFNATTLTLGYNYSLESDFESHAVLLGASQELLQKNFTVSAVYRYATEDINNPTTRPDDVFPRTKAAHTLTLTALQLLDQYTWLQGGYSYGRVDGYQSNPQRKVLIPVAEPLAGLTISTVLDEHHPSTRNRHTLFLRAKRYFLSRTVADVNLAGYADDWGLHAFSTELRASQYLTDNLTLRLRYRYYLQGAADFYRARYTQAQALLTADERLRAFATHTAGIKLTYNLQPFGLANWLLAFIYDRYQETHGGLTAHIWQGSLHIPF